MLFKICFIFTKNHNALVDFPVANLTSAENRTNWVKQQVATASQRYTDGINIDFESALSKENSHYLIALVNETVQAFRAANPYAQVSLSSY